MEQRNNRSDLCVYYTTIFDRSFHFEKTQMVTITFAKLDLQWKKQNCLDKISPMSNCDGLLPPTDRTQTDEFCCQSTTTLSSFYNFLSSLLYDGLPDPL